MNKVSLFSIFVSFLLVNPCEAKKGINYFVEEIFFNKNDNGDDFEVIISLSLENNTEKAICFDAGQFFKSGNYSFNVFKNGKIVEGDDIKIAHPEIQEDSVFPDRRYTVGFIREGHKENLAIVLSNYFKFSAGNLYHVSQSFAAISCEEFLGERMSIPFPGELSLRNEIYKIRDMEIIKETLKEIHKEWAKTGFFVDLEEFEVDLR